MFPFLSILQHYAEFNICTITTLEKLFGVGSFGVFIGHLTCHQAILLVFLGKLGFLFIIQTIAVAFLECWAMISFALVIHF
jgi:hypothetical protein